MQRLCNALSAPPDAGWKYFRPTPLVPFLMKKFPLILLSLIVLNLVTIGAASAQTGGVGIGTTTPNSGAVLDLNSDSKSLILPRLTTQAMNAVSAPVPGMFVFNTDNGKFFGYGSRGSYTTLTNQPTIVYTSAGPAFYQSFKVPNSASMDAITFYANGPGLPSLTLTVSLLSGDGIAGSVIATATTTVTGSTPTFARAIFPAGIPLQANTFYAFKIIPSGPSVGALLNVLSGGPSDPYPNGRRYDAGGNPS